MDPGDGSGPRTVDPGSSLDASYGPGSPTVTATATAGTDSLSVRLPLSVAAATDHPPVADAGGPYRVDLGAGLTLDASRSSDPDSADTMSFAWDLDGDGTFADATGATVDLPVDPARGPRLRRHVRDRHPLRRGGAGRRRSRRRR